MPSTNQNPDKAERNAALVGALAKTNAVKTMSQISTFNLEVAIRALRDGFGGTLTITIPTQEGKPALMVYEGLQP